MTDGVVVVNAGPLISLAMARCLNVLGLLYGRVLVPEAVYAEVVEQGAGLVGAREVASAEFLHRTPVDPGPDPFLVAALGPGEAQVIALGHRCGAHLVILDERRARRIAERAYGLRVKGSAGVLVAAKRAGHVDAVRPLLMLMLERGYRLSERLVARACQEVGE